MHHDMGSWSLFQQPWLDYRGWKWLELSYDTGVLSKGFQQKSLVIFLNPCFSLFLGFCSNMLWKSCFAIFSLMT